MTTKSHQGGPQATFPRLLLLLGFVASAAFWLLEALVHSVAFKEGSFLAMLWSSDPNELWMRSLVCFLLIGLGVVASVLAERWLRAQREICRLTREREAMLAKALGAFIPICMHCKSIRDENQDWQQLERYMTEKTSATFSHSLCPTCESQYYPE